ncbi:MAG: hypothetical protein LBH73_08090 [Spirochaetaceae bacterium]|nr:hypothetical protein [Spirochaetaceae bacterium]
MEQVSFSGPRFSVRPSRTDKPRANYAERKNGGGVGFVKQRCTKGETSPTAIKHTFIHRRMDIFYIIVVFDIYVKQKYKKTDEFSNLGSFFLDFTLII